MFFGGSENNLFNGLIVDIILKDNDYLQVLAALYLVYYLQNIPLLCYFMRIHSFIFSLIHDLHADDKNTTRTHLSALRARPSAAHSLYQADAHGECPIMLRPPVVPSNQTGVSTWWAGPERPRRGTLR